MHKFPPQARLKTAHDFLAPIRKGHKLVENSMTVFVLPNDLGFARIGISIRKTRVKNATCRNRLKRTIREQFRLLPFAISGDIVIIVAQGLAEASNQKIRERLTKLWQQIRDFLAT